jgi:hypothetical protein
VPGTEEINYVIGGKGYPLRWFYSHEQCIMK